MVAPLESAILRRVLLACGSLPGVRLFRNNVAQGVVGQIDWVRRTRTVTLGPGDCIVRHARILHAGLHVGSGDLIGWSAKMVTPDMLGQAVAVFTSIETKAKRGRVSDAQQNFQDVVRTAGGIAIVARSEDEALEGLR
jgi:hypothetical protein